MYEDMLYDEYAKDFTKNAGFGLAESAYLQLKQYHKLENQTY
jgi:flagellar protein FlgJ